MQIKTIGKLVLTLLITIFTLINFSIFLSQKIQAYGTCNYGQSTYGSDCDDLPPTGSITINGGATSTTSATVTLTISATDNSGTVNSMMISENSNFQGADWEAYATSKSFTLSGLGLKTIYIKFIDGVGNISTTYFDQINFITLATGSPSVTTTPTTTNVQIVSFPTVSPTTTFVGNSQEQAKIFYRLKLVDANKNTIAEAKIIIETLNISAITNSDGIINLGYIAKGTYKVKIEYSDKIYEQNFTVGDEDLVTLELSESLSNSNYTLLIICIILLGVGVIGYIFLKRKNTDDEES